MRLWRLLVELDRAVWTFVVAAPGPVVAWNLVQEALGPRASLEELEGTEERSRGRARILHTWRTSPGTRLTRSSGTA